MRNKGKVLFIIHNLYQVDTFYNIGTGYLVSVLKKYGAEVTIFDMAIEDLNEEQLADYLQDNNNFDLICMGFLSARYKETVEPLCKVINKYKNKALLVLGCNGASAIPEYTLKQTQADIICIGESEESIVEVLNCKVNDGNFANINGIAYRNGDKVFITPSRKPIQNLDSIPFPSWSDFNMEKYTSNIKLALMDDNDKCFPLVSTRGCVNACTFCYRMHKGVRVRSIDNIIQEMKLLNQNWGISYYFFFDEMWLINEARVIEFAKALEKNSLDIKFNINVRVDMFTESIARRLKDCGCVFINAGFESLTQGILNEMKKNALVEQNIRVAEIANKFSIGLGLNALWGFKGDNEESLRKNVDFIKKYNQFDQVRTVRFPTCYPGCELFWESIANGQLKDEDDFFNKFKNSDLMTVNYTDLPLEECYRLMYEANRELILHHYENTNKDFVTANKLIQDFKDLYDGKDIKFRGARSDATNEDKRKITR